MSHRDGSLKSRKKKKYSTTATDGDCGCDDFDDDCLSRYID